MEKIINYRILRVQILVAYICLFLSISVQAQNSWISLPSGEKITAGEDEPQCYYYEIENGEVKIRKMEDPKDVVKVIVTLKDKPIALYKSKKGLRKVSLMSVLSSLKQTHSSVSSKIEQIASRLSSGSNFKYSFKINREYFTAINAMAMECNREMIRHIRELPEVKSVHLDREVKACLTESVKQIRADIVQDSLGYSGEGVLVGVIDTGLGDAGYCGFDEQDVVIMCGGLEITGRLHNDQEPSLVLHLTVGHAMSAQHLRARQLQQHKDARMVQHPHPVRLGIPHPNLMGVGDGVVHGRLPP